MREYTKQGISQYVPIYVYDFPKFSYDYSHMCEALASRLARKRCAVNVDHSSTIPPITTEILRAA